MQFRVGQTGGASTLWVILLVLSKVILTGYSESVTVDTNEGPRKASWWGHHLQNDIMINMVLSSITTEVKEAH